MDDERLLDDLPRPHPGIQRRIRILKNDLHVAPRRAQPAAREAEHVLAPKNHRPRCRFDQPEQAAAGRRLAAARFSDETEGLALLDIEADVVHARGRSSRGGTGPSLARSASPRWDDLDERHHDRPPGRRPGNRGEQRAGIGVLRPVEDVAHRRLFDDFARIHHGHPIGGLRDHAEIVGDEEHRQVIGRAHLPEEVENLRLNRDVERRRRLVCDHQRGPAGQGEGDQHALPHAAGELVRVVVHSRGGVRNPDRLEQLDRPAVGVAPRHTAVDEQCFANLIADREDRVERRHRLLEDERDLGAPDVAHLALGQRQQLAPLEGHRAADDPAGRLNEPHDRQRRDRLAAS